MIMMGHVMNTGNPVNHATFLFTRPVCYFRHLFTNEIKANLCDKVLSKQKYFTEAADLPYCCWKMFIQNSDRVLITPPGHTIIGKHLMESTSKCLIRLLPNIFLDFILSD